MFSIAKTFCGCKSEIKFNRIMTELRAAYCAIYVKFEAQKLLLMPIRYGNVFPCYICRNANYHAKQETSGSHRCHYSAEPQTKLKEHRNVFFGVKR